MMISYKKRIALITFLLSALLLVLGWFLLPQESKAAFAESDAPVQNELLDREASISVQAPTAYALQESFTYAAVTDVPLPRMRYEGEGNTLRFALYLSYMNGAEQEICGSFSDDEFTYYVNEYMPAGRYRLTASYGAVQDCTTGWWNDSSFSAVSCDEFTAEYSFVVQSAAHSYGDEVSALDSHLQRREFSFDYTGETLLPDNIRFDEIIYSRGNAESSFWATADADVYFAGYTVTYKVNGTENAHYHTAAELNDSELMTSVDHLFETVPQDAGVYRIYYRLEAANFAPSVVSDYSRYFDLTVIETLPVPVIENETYTGSALRPHFESSRLYYAVYPEEGCIDAGEYTVEFILRDTKCYKWAGKPLGVAGVSASFTIDKSENSWIVPLAVANWTYGTYDPLIHSPVSAPRFFDRDATVRYSYIESNAAGEECGEPTVNIPTEAGWYYLVAEIAEGKNYFALTGKTRFQITQATNVWEVTPNITRWRFGEYDDNINRPVGQAISGDTQFTFYRLDQNGDRLGEGVSSLDEFRRESDGKIPAGSYLMCASVENSRNYAALYAEVPFNVLKARNQWTTTPDIVRWHYGQYTADSNTPYAVPLYGKAEDVKFSFYLADENGNPTGDEYPDSMNGLRNADGKVPAGKYILSAVLAESEDFEGLHSNIQFEILQANNYWEEAPTITRWNQGSFDPEINAINGKSAFGEVTFTVKDANGIVQTDLASLKAGVYTLSAFVEGTNNYTQLDSSVTFVVFSPVGGDESVAAIVASILLGVACLGLISAFIALFIHYKKNYSEE